MNRATGPPSKSRWNFKKWNPQISQMFADLNPNNLCNLWTKKRILLRREKTMKLKKMKVGECGVVTEFSTSDPHYRQKLLRMGLNRNAEFTVVRKSLFGGPIEIEVKASRLVLRSDEADAFEVEKK